MSGDRPTISVVTVAYGAEPWLEPSVRACLDSTDEVVEVVLVDNGCTDGAVDRLESVDGVVVVRPGLNTGFAGGCNLGVATSRAPLVAFVNPDALAQPDALHLLAERSRATGGITTACVVLADRPELVNSAGNEFHFLGLSWSGGFEEPVARHQVAGPTIAASGAAMLMPAGLFDELGGFTEELFAYYEDAELSIRAWQHGSRVDYVPGAVVAHRYEFGRNELKYFLLDRNRWICMLTLFEGRTLALIAPLIVVQEAALWVLALVEGWAGPKVRATRWLVGHRVWLRERRRDVANARRVGDRDLVSMITGDLTPTNVAMPSWVAPFRGALRVYWSFVRRLLTR